MWQKLFLALLISGMGLSLLACTPSLSSQNAGPETGLSEAPPTLENPPPLEAEISAPTHERRLNPYKLVGLEMARIEALLGPPELRQKMGPSRSGGPNAGAESQMWQYRNAECTMLVFFFKDAEAIGPRLTHFDINGRNGVSQTRDQCFRALVCTRPGSAAFCGAAGAP